MLLSGTAAHSRRWTACPPAQPSLSHDSLASLGPPVEALIENTGLCLLKFKKKTQYVILSVGNNAKGFT